MHLLLGISLIAVLIAYAIGETAARIFVGVCLALMASLVLIVAYISVLETQRQIERQPAVVRMGSAR